MPTYDYQCRACRHTIEVIHSMMETGPTSCERCGGELRRVLYPAGIIFKGSGFYRTDSRASGSDSASSASTSTAPTAEGKGAGGSGDAGGTSSSSGTSSPSGTSSSSETSTAIGSDSAKRESAGRD